MSKIFILIILNLFLFNACSSKSDAELCNLITIKEPKKLKNKKVEKWQVKEIK